MNSISTEEERGLRLIKLLDEAVNVLRQYLLDYFAKSTITLEEALKVHELKLRKTLKPEQCELLYPKTGSTNPDRYDVSLIYVLLRVLVKIPRPKTGWYNVPLTTDQSLSAQIVRIHLSRNELLHDRLKKTDADFRKHLDYIGRSMEALGCDRSCINNIINVRLDENTAYLLEQRIADLTALEESHRELAMKMEELESCFGKSVWFDVCPLLPSFTGRNDIVKDVHEAIEQSTQGQQIATVISGLPGTGKTSLAQYYCYEYGEVYDNNVVWIHADTLESLKASFFRLAQCLKIMDEGNCEGEVGVTLLITRVFKFFADKTCLFVLDNVTDSQFILNYLPQNLPPSIQTPIILVTSKRSIWGERFFEINIGRLTDSESRELIVKSLPQDLIANQEETSCLINLLDGYPLALQQALAYIKYSMITITEYVEEFQQVGGRFQLLDFPSNDTPYSGKVATSLLVILNTIDSIDDKQIAEILNLLSLLDGESIDPKFLTKNQTIDNKLTSTIMTLENFSLIHVERNYLLRKRFITIHSVVQLIIQERLIEREQLGRTIIHAFSLIGSAINCDNPDYASSRWLHHVLHMYDKLKANNVFLGKLSLIKDDLFKALEQTGNEEKAIDLLVGVRRYCEECHGVFTSEVYDTLYLIYRAYVNLKRWENALLILQSIELLSGEKWTESDHEYWIMQHNKALCLSELGKAQEALSIYNEVIKKETKYFGDNNVSTIITKLNASVELRRAGRLTEALNIQNECITQLHQRKYRTSTYYYDAIHYKVQTLRHSGKYDEAEDILKTSVQECIEYHGKNHNCTIALVEVHAKVLMKKNMFEQALLLLKDLESHKKRNFNAKHPTLLGVTQSVATCCFQMGKLQEALNLYEQVRVETVAPIAIFGIDHQIAECYFRLGRYKEAVQLVKEIKLKKLEVYGNKNKEVVLTEIQLCLFMYHMGCYQDTIKLIDANLSFVKKKLEKKDIIVIRLLLVSALCYEKIGMFNYAFSLYEECMFILEKHYDGDMPYLQVVKFNRAICWLSSGLHHKALELFLEETRKKIKDHLGLMSQYFFAKCLTNLERYDEALDVFAENKQLGQILYHPNHVLNLRIYHQIARCKFHKGNISEAKQDCVYVIEQLADDIRSSHVLVVDVKILLSRCLLFECATDGALKTCKDAIEGAKELVDTHPLLVEARKTLDACEKAVKRIK